MSLPLDKLPPPDWQSDDGCAALYHGDAQEVLAAMPDQAVSAGVTDPPFGINWSRATWADDAKDYPALMDWLVSEFRRVVQGWCFVFQAMPNVSRFHEWFPDGWRLFAACKNFAQIRPTGVWYSWDPVVFWNQGPNSGPNSGHVSRDYFVGNVAGVFGEQIGHPCPKPADTMEHIVQLAAARQASCLDPFLGSGTTGVACVRTGRSFIGVEIHRPYFDIAVRRIQEAIDSQALFRQAEQPKEVQGSLLEATT